MNLQLKIAAILVLLSAFGFGVYKIDGNGYNRCETEHKAAESAAKDDARKKIVPAERKYENLKNSVALQTGDNNIVGPRISTAINGLPDAGID